MNAATAIDRSAAQAIPPPRIAAPVEFLPLGPVSPAFAAQWDDLAANAAEPNVFAERWFVSAGAAHLHPGPDGRLLAVRDAGQLIGLLPLTTKPRYGRLPIRHVENWLHYHCFLGGPLLRRGHEQAAWTLILATLDADPQATGLLHLTGLVENGPVHRALLAVAGRPCDTVHRIERALLETTLSPQAYYEATVRKKKRKEIKRLQSRLAELGAVTNTRLTNRDDLPGWIDTYLALEQSGWKGRSGSALACQPHTAAFFRDALTGAFDAGRLELLRLDLDERPLAMLVNFLAAPGSFSFKTAFDEEFARYSPGVLVQLENLAILNRPGIAWMDSCASADHPMIDSLWGERRAIVRVTLPFAGWRSRALFHAARAVERAADALRARRQRPSAPPEIEE
ncbi:GNAT family N-acetyltransferase [Sphingomonas sp. BT-65]|uniref:GNAT family N-acetyltransferase n=1 Tax=Sphingomonas sp. BT-65 TaxID=2989821 RepID=UPI002236B03E|nr:GNAT family N-acetyltransferase [Sphingomonas sp. BT-65]MCW4461620.1 GNAT family N-acetyltransferase [Sphingomonas sp. BT-65]